MRLLIDMNLSPRWIEFFQSHDVEAAHWSANGNKMASDQEILTYARNVMWPVSPTDFSLSERGAGYRCAQPSLRIGNQRASISTSV